MMLYFIPVLLQGVALFFDEFYFHRKRGLPLWERLGHPLDTLTVLICYLFIYWMPPSPLHLNIYIGLCAFSCLFVTKDEFVHTEVCDALENWLHAVLFLLHPITFMCAGYVWMNQLNPVFISVQIGVILFFMVYQTVYWSFFAKNK